MKRVPLTPEQKVLLRRKLAEKYADRIRAREELKSKLLKESPYGASREGLSP